MVEEASLWDVKRAALESECFIFNVIVLVPIFSVRPEHERDNSASSVISRLH